VALHTSQLRRVRWAGGLRNLLTWAWRGVQLEAAISRARYVIQSERHEVLTWAEVRDLGGRRRVEIGSVPVLLPPLVTLALGLLGAWVVSSFERRGA
jgi:hypothetical protein